MTQTRLPLAPFCMILFKYPSPGACRYAWEISTVEGGWGLHNVLASRTPTLDGIVNGIDLVEWNPASDKHTPAKYSAADPSGAALPALL